MDLLPVGLQPYSAEKQRKGGDKDLKVSLTSESEKQLTILIVVWGESIRI